MSRSPALAFRPSRQRQPRRGAVALALLALCAQAACKRSNHARVSSVRARAGAGGLRRAERSRVAHRGAFDVEDSRRRAKRVAPRLPWPIRKPSTISTHMPTS